MLTGTPGTRPRSGGPTAAPGASSDLVPETAGEPTEGFHRLLVLVPAAGAVVVRAPVVPVSAAPTASAPCSASAAR